MEVIGIAMLYSTKLDADSHRQDGIHRDGKLRDEFSRAVAASSVCRM